MVKFTKLLMAFSILFLSVISSFTISHASKDTGPSLVRVPYKSPSQIGDMVEQGIDILHLSPQGYLDVVADSRQLDYLFSQRVPVSVIGTPQMAMAAPALDNHLGDYHTYAEMESVLAALDTNYPALASLSSIGTSVEGRTIYALKISDNVSVDEDEPEVLYIGCHHARELMSVDVPLRFAEYLLTNYGSLPEVTGLVDSREIYFVPMLNPDGHYFVQQNHGGSWWTWWRKNRRDNGDGSYGIDLNRNYGYEWGYDDIGSSPTPSSDVYRGPSPFSEPETQVIRDFSTSRNFGLWFSYHSYGELLLYPWGYISGYTPDHELYYALGDTLTSSNGYFDGNTAMGAIYTVNGDSDDWAYGDETGKDKIFAFTPEVNTYEEGGFGPPDTLIIPTFNKLLPMNMLLLDLADSPERVLPPVTPAMYPIDDPYHPIFTLSWSGN
ncbi:MAG: zinc carboxypeptidase, partial [Gammaproteobacteria bacterium]|nr:zinc carboxypeptidase [Gammaproteobacteria bacterium]